MPTRSRPQPHRHRPAPAPPRCPAIAAIAEAGIPRAACAGTRQPQRPAAAPHRHRCRPVPECRRGPGPAAPNPAWRTTARRTGSTRTRRTPRRCSDDGCAPDAGQLAVLLANRPEVVTSAVWTVVAGLRAGTAAVPLGALCVVPRPPPGPGPPSVMMNMPPPRPPNPPPAMSAIIPTLRASATLRSAKSKRLTKLGVPPRPCGPAR